MAEEIFDVVNDHDEVIDQKPRREVHRLGLKHRAVHIIVTNAKGDVFMQKRSLSKDSSPGLWDTSAAGHVDSGETYDTCSIRELREEIGLSITQPPRRLCYIKACQETAQEFVWVYHTVSEGPFVLHPEEIETGEWFTTKHLEEWIASRPQDFATSFLRVWAEAKGSL
jgi:isopentenyl-diphosphate Delta-isomerase